MGSRAFSGASNREKCDSLRLKDPASAALPDDVAALKAAFAAERAQKLAIEAELAIAHAKASEDMALIAQQKLRIAKLERRVYGQRSERSARLIEQLALEFEELAVSATEDELAAERAVAWTTNVRGFARRPAERNTFPEHLPRERVAIAPPKNCECCGGLRLRKLGEDVTRTLEVTPRRWKVIETVREKSSCRDCEAISHISPKDARHAVTTNTSFPAIARAKLRWKGLPAVAGRLLVSHACRSRGELRREGRKACTTMPYRLRTREWRRGILLSRPIGAPRPPPHAICGDLRKRQLPLQEQLGESRQTRKGETAELDQRLTQNHH
jgi:hypothetical protein